MPTSTPLQPTITTAGLTAIFNAEDTGVEFALTHIAFGTAQYTPDGSETALRAEQVRVPIAGGGRISPTQIQIYAVAMAALGHPFFVGEVGFFGDDGATLLAVYSSTATPSLFLSDTVSTSVSYALGLAALPANTVTVTIDPSASAALLLLGNHVAAADPHPQYVQKVNGVAFYDPTLTFNQGAQIIGDDLLVYQSAQANNIGHTPSSSPTWWVPLYNYGNTPVTGLAGVDVTLSSTQAARAHITLSGALTAPLNVIFPGWVKEWIVLNKTTGAFSLTCKTAAGTGVAVPQNSSPTRIYGDGTNIVQVAENVAPATASPHPVQLGQLGALPNSQYLSTAGKVNGVNNPNQLFNGSGEFGNAGWSASNFGASTEANGGDPYFTNAAPITTGSFVEDVSGTMPWTPGASFCVSAEASTSGMTQGSAYVKFDFFNSSGGVLTGGASASLNFGSSGYSFVTATGVAPATTAFVKIHKGAQGNPLASAGGVSFRRIKGELGATPSLYSQEASIAQLAGAMPVVGSVRNLVMSVAAASASATLTADEIVVETALGGFGYKLANFNKTINLATTGAGGMDTGTAPVSGYVAVYAIYNPTTQTAALLVKNAATLQPNIYGGTNMPAGYTASALVGVWPTNGSGQFVIGYQADRTIYIATTSALTTSVQQASYTSLSISLVVPQNAKTIIGETAVNSSSIASNSCFLSASASAIGEQQINSGNGGIVGNYTLPLITPQTLYYKANSNTGTMSLTIGISGYTI